MTREQKIRQALEGGMTVDIATHLTVTRITPRQYRRWERDGIQMFRTDASGSTYVARGKAWDCIDFCRITASA